MPTLWRKSQNHSDIPHNGICELRRINSQGVSHGEKEKREKEKFHFPRFVV